MTKKLLWAVGISSAVICFIFIVSSESARARRKAPVDFQVDNKNYDLTIEQVKTKLKTGWSLGGVYPDCGEGFGEVEVTADVAGELLPFYEKLQEQTKEEMLKLLNRTNTPEKSREILNKIIAGKSELTRYGTLPPYSALQNRFDEINSIMAEIKSSPAGTGVTTIGELVGKLETFVKSGSTPDVNAARKAVQTIAVLIKKYPEQVMDEQKSVDDNLAQLERIRKAVKGSLEKADKEGTGCRMVYVFYRPI